MLAETAREHLFRILLALVIAEAGANMLLVLAGFALSWYIDYRGITDPPKVADTSPTTRRVEDAGGTVVMGKSQVSPEIGYIAVIDDTEGNRVYLHSMS